jgi:hypothetical protein
MNNSHCASQRGVIIAVDPKEKIFLAYTGVGYF